MAETQEVAAVPSAAAPSTAAPSAAAPSATALSAAAPSSETPQSEIQPVAQPAAQSLPAPPVHVHEKTPMCHVPGITAPLWGPGWLADPLHLSFEYDDVVAVADPLAPSLRGEAGEDEVDLAPVLRSTGKLSGALVVSLADGCFNVPHQGIHLTLTTLVESFQSSSRDVHALQSHVPHVETAAPPLRCRGK